MKNIILILSLTALTACNHVLESDFMTTNANAVPQITQSPATSVQCPNGGTVFTENDISTVICNGLSGEQGPAGSPGASITGPQGPQGQPGATGPAGSTGKSGTDGNGYLPGLECDVYSILVKDEMSPVNWETLLSDGTLQFSTVLTNFNVANQSSNDVFASFTASQQALIGNTNYAIDCYGYLNVPETGEYTLTLASDDGSELALDETVVIDMPQTQPMTSKSATVSLFSGLHRINVLYFQGPPVMIGLILSWQGPSNAGLGANSVIPSSAFQH